ncbi:methyltransferase domain-containing protein [Limnoglobus roseus]|uniref:Methyltransferase domain-containing protein n=1 Tax=Limnoglobus roseus TaxID=2598579 RepID=A0A5C1A4G8_9BACT|nr:methyltransferase domain-containing protein [Limnoglobus roseus]QEL13277.1 methyltransferase domain-containing protein [Limnoglobus roseus]
MLGLSRRDRRPELMDDPALDAAEHRRALAGLARLNAVSNGAGAVWYSIRALASELSRPIRVLDVASGSGDGPVAMAGMAKRAGFSVAFAGCDISPTAVAAATERAATANAPVEFFQHDVLKDDLPGGFDVVTCSLFLHHLDEPDAVLLLQRMDRAATALGIVSDLSRSRWNYLQVWFACRLLTRSPVVRYDGPVSVRAAFTPAEATALAKRAGLKNVHASPRFPCRFQLSWRKR